MMKPSLRRLTLPFALLGVLGPAGVAAADGGVQAAEGGNTTGVLRMTDAPSDPAAVAVMRTGTDGQVAQVRVGDLRLTDLDSSGQAVLTRPHAVQGGQNADEVRPGDVVAAPATARTPHGALVKVTHVDRGTDGETVVHSRPAQLTELLGDATVDLRIPLTQKDIAVKPLAAGASVRKAANGAANGVHFDIDVPAPSGVTATEGHSAPLSASVDFSPELLFSYERAHWYSVAPSKARIGLGGDYRYAMKVHAHTAGSVRSGHKPLRIPAAEVNVDKTVWLGPVPLVLNLKVDYFYNVSADGRLSVDAEEHTEGRLEAGARYDQGHGWSALSSSKPTSRATPVKIDGSATARAGLGAHTQLGLYGAVGVAADVEPYAKAAVSTRDGRADWALYAGADVTGSFFAKLKIFGTPVVDESWALPLVRWEDKLAGGSN